jgi:hypothetical protein
MDLASRYLRELATVLVVLREMGATGSTPCAEGGWRSRQNVGQVALRESRAGGNIRRSALMFRGSRTVYRSGPLVPSSGWQDRPDETLCRSCNGDLGNVGVDGPVSRM